MSSVEVLQKLRTLEAEDREIMATLDFLRDVEPTRKVYRNLGGVLAERTASEAIEAIEMRGNFVKRAIDSLKALNA